MLKTPLVPSCMSLAARAGMLTASFLLLSLLSRAQPFQLTSDTFLPLYNGSVHWADLDGDGDLDIVYCGFGHEGQEFYTKVYENDGGAFTEATTALPAIRNGSFALGDYDGDGDLDILLSGLGETGNISGLYRNDGAFTFALEHSFPGLINTTTSWFDIDNDGDLDIMLSGVDDTTTGEDPFIEQTLVYENDGGTFTLLAGTNLPACTQCAMKWADSNGDGKVDLALSGFGDDGYGHSALYLNNGDKTFSRDEHTVLRDFFNGSLAWGDYDNDGDMDLLLGGAQQNSEIYSIVYENNGRILEERTDIHLAGATENWQGGNTWADYNNDGRLDILIAGRSVSLLETAVVFKAYKNNGDGTFTEDADANLSPLHSPALDVADFDNDGDVDIVFSGFLSGTLKTGIYGNALLSGVAASNTRPLPPSAGSFYETFFRKEAALHWSEGSDAETPTPGLTYNFYLRSADENVVMPNASPTTGFVESYNAANGQARRAIVRDIPEGELFWAVQSVDGGRSGSLFSPEKTFYQINGPEAVSAAVVDVANVRLTWVDNSSVESGYQIARSTEALTGFAPVADVNENTGEHTDNHDFLTDTFYYYRIAAVNAAGTSAYDSLRVLIPTSPGTLSAEALNASSIALSWDDRSAFETGYAIERKGPADAAFGVIAELAAGAVGFEDEGLEEGTVYAYRVRALNEYGSSGFSNTADVATNSRPAGTSFGKEALEDHSVYFSTSDFEEHFSDPDDGDALVRITVNTLPAEGTLLLEGTPVAAGMIIPAGSLGALAFYAGENVNGTFSFEIFVHDGMDNAATSSSVDLDIVAVNDPPRFTVEAEITADEDFTAPLLIKPLPLVPADEISQTISYALSPVVSDRVTVYFEPVTGEILLTAIPDQSGDIAFTLTADDGQPENAVFAAVFTVSILPVNDPPELSAIPDLEVEFSAAMQPIPVTVHDVDDPLSALVLSATSDNHQLVADEKITFSGEGAVREIHVAPEDRRLGEAVVTITARDGKSASSTTFRVNVFAVTQVHSRVREEPVIISPNPVVRALRVTAGGLLRPPFRLTIRDMLGRPVLERVITEEDSSIDVSGFEPGMYLLDISGRGHHRPQAKIIKQ